MDMTNTESPKTQNDFANERQCEDCRETFIADENDGPELCDYCIARYESQSETLRDVQRDITSLRKSIRF